MKEAHAELLQAHRDTRNSLNFLDRVRGFLARGTVTGARVGLDAERYAAQSLLDYWATVLYRATGASPLHVELAEFQPELEPDLKDVPCPYLGLDPHQADVGKSLFGCEKIIEECAGRLQRGHLVALLGAAGSGRSYLVDAGLMPALQRGQFAERFPGSAGWRYVSIAPGADPLRSLAEAFVPPSAGDRAAWVLRQVLYFRTRPDALAKLVDEQGPAPVVVAVDSFEQVFTLCDDSRDRLAFVANLLRLVEGGASARHYLILVVRREFERDLEQLTGTPMAGQPGAAPGRLEQATVFLRPLTASELRAAILEPAGRVGLKFDPPEIVDQLVFDTQGDPAALPLLQFTLQRLWERRSRNRITWEAYKSLGGGRGALQTVAEETYKGLAEEDKPVARRLLLQLVRPTLGSDVTVHFARRAELGQGPEGAVADKLLAAGLLRLVKGKAGADDEVTIAHEALVSHWPALQRWVDEERRRQIAVQATRQLRFLLAAAAAVLVVVLGLLATSVVYYIRAKASEQAAKTAEENERRVRRDMQEQVVHESADHGLRVAEAGDHFAGLLWMGKALTLCDDDAQRAAQAFRMEAVLQQMPALAHQAFHGSTIKFAAVQPVGDPPLLATAGADGKVRLWNLRTGDPVGEPLSEHKGAVNQVAFSDDGRRLVSAGEDGEANVWDVETGQRVAGPLKHEQSIACAAFSPGGKGRASRYVLTASADKTASLWDAATGARVGPLLKHKGRVLYAAFHPNGQSLVTASDSGRAILWALSPDTGAAQINELNHAGPVTYVAFSRDGRLLATASADGSVGLWDAGNGASLRVFQAHAGAVTSVQFSPDGRRLLTASQDRTAQVWQVQTYGSSVTAGLDVRAGTRPGVMVYTDPLGPPLRHGNWVNHAEFSPDGRYVVTASRDQTACVWDAATGRQLTPRLRHLGSVTHATFGRGGRGLLTVGADAAEPVRVWDLYRGLSATPFPLGIRGTLSCAAASPDGSWVLTAASLWDRPAEIQLWEQKTGKLLTARPVRPEERVTHAAFSPDGSRVLFATGDAQMGQSRAYVWEVEALNSGKGSAAYTLQPAGLVTHAAFGPKSRRVVTVSRDWAAATGRAQLWDGQTGELVKDLPTKSLVTYAGFSVDGARLITCGGTWGETSPQQSGEAIIWDTARGDEVARLEGHTEAVSHAAFSPDGLRVATASEDDTARIWDASDGKILSKLQGHSSDVTHVAFSPDGDRLVTTSLDQTACLWDLKAGAQLTPLLKHTQAVKQAAFSPDGRLVVTAGADGAARVWDVASRAAVTPPIEHNEPVQAAVFSADGRHLFVLSHQETSGERHAITGEPLLPPAMRGPQGRLPRETTVPTPAHTITVLHWRLPEGDRDREHLPALAQLLATRKLEDRKPHERDLTPVTGDELRRKWKELRAAYPEVLSGDLSNKTFLQWHWRETNLAEGARQPFAVAWHLGKILERDELLAADEKLKPEARARLLVRRGRAYASSQEWKLAVGDFTDALKFRPDDDDWCRPLLEERARARASLSDWDSAAADYVEVLKLKPSNESAVRAALINAYTALGKWREVIEECQTALARDPMADSLERRWARALLERQWARAHAELGEWAEAAAHLHEAANRDASSQPTWHQMALVRLRAGHEAGYQKACAESLKRFGRAEHDLLANNVAWTCVIGPKAVEHPNEVVDLATKAVRRGPGNYHYLNTLGAALYRADNYEEAYTRLTEAMSAYSKPGSEPPMGMMPQMAMDPPADGGAALDWLFMAMVQHHRPGQAEDARKWFDKADAWINTNVPHLTEKAADSRLTWDKRLELHLLRDEARKELKLPNP
jgi:WD40 repeat protein/tetratricopeptide (TPR) repeat protein